MQELIGLGYWRSLQEPALPDPARFVDEQWDAGTRQAVIRYLTQGHPLSSWMGYSWCRFRCGIANCQMGSGDLTDGTYCWPEGLVHYVQCHAVRLPDAVVEHILAQPVFPHSKAAQTSEASPTITTWWAAQPGWNSAASSFFGESDENEREYLRRFDQGRVECNSVSEADTEARVRMIRQIRSRELL